MRTRKINGADMTKLDPVNHPGMIVVNGVSPDRTSDSRSMISDRLPDCDAISGAENSWTVAMKSQRGRPERPRRHPGHRDHPQSHRPARRERA
jgi:hypothetical protein